MLIRYHFVTKTDYDGFRRNKWVIRDGKAQLIQWMLS